MVANMIGKILYQIGLLITEKVTVVQRTDLVASYIGHTRPKTRKKVTNCFVILFNYLYIYIL
jgi:hypothetical protein